MPKLLLVAGLAILSFVKVDCSIAGDAADPPSKPTVSNAPPSLSDKASIDCTKAGSTVAKILCGSREGAMADWDLNSTLWATAGTTTEAQQKSFDHDQSSWRGLLNKKCVQLPSAIDVSQDQQRCVISEFHTRAANLRSKLAGDGLAESKLTPEQHAQIQELLIAQGLLQLPADGEFGTSTRQAIRKFQEIKGAAQTGFLSSEQTSQLRTAQQPPPSTSPPVAVAVSPPAKGAEVDCTAVLPHPLVRAASVQAVAEMRKRDVGLSETGARDAVTQRVFEIVYERNGQLARLYANQIRTSTSAITEACLPDLMHLMADVREQNKRLAAQAKEAAEQAAKPENRLYRAYRRYAYIKACYEMRLGYAMIYITDAELDRAREKITGIEKDALAEIGGKDFNTTSLFSRAVDANHGMSASYDACHIELRNILGTKSNGGNYVLEKDF
jgi:hypothetical protein